MAKRQRKVLDIEIDTKHVDLKLKRNAEGKIEGELDIDTKVVDVHATKDTNGLKVSVEINDKEVYDFESNGKDRSLKKTIVKVSGSVARVLIAKGLGKIIK